MTIGSFLKNMVNDFGSPGFSLNLFNQLTDMVLAEVKFLIFTSINLLEFDNFLNHLLFIWFQKLWF